MAIFPKLFVARYAQSTLSVFKRGDESDKNTPLAKALELYQMETHRFFGFGWVLSFIPRTAANRARHQLAECNRAKLSGYPTNNVSNFLLKSPFPFLFRYYNRIRWVNLTALAKIQINQKHTLKELVLMHAVVQAWFRGSTKGSIERRPDRWKRLFRLLLNPVILLTDTLHVLHLLINRGLEVFGTKNEPSGWLPQLLKGLVMVIALPLKTLCAMLEVVADIPYQLVSYFIVGPITFVANSIHYSAKSIGYVHVHGSIGDVQAANTLLTLATEDTPQAADETSVQLFGIDGEDYRKLEHTNTFIACRMSKKEGTSLLTALGMWKAQKADDFDDLLLDTQNALVAALKTTLTTTS